MEQALKAMNIHMHYRSQDQETHVNRRKHYVGTESIPCPATVTPWSSRYGRSSLEKESVCVGSLEASSPSPPSFSFLPFGRFQTLPFSPPSKYSAALPSLPPSLESGDGTEEGWKEGS